MKPVIRFAVLYLAALILLNVLTLIGLAVAVPFLHPPLIIIAAYVSGGRGVVTTLRMLIALVVVRLLVILVTAGPEVLPHLLREFVGAPVLLTLWMLSSLIVPGLLIAGGVWTRHMIGPEKEHAP